MHRIGRVDRRRQAVAVPVRELDRLIERLERRDAHDRSERLSTEELVIGHHAVDDRRVIEEARFGVVADEAFPRSLVRDPTDGARAQHAMMIADQVEPFLESLREASVDHRPIQDVAGRFADRRFRDRLREPGEEVVVHVGVDDRSAERRASLPRRSEAAEQGAFDGEVEVRVGHHDERILPAQLQTRRLEVAAAELAETLADRRGPGEADFVDQPFVERSLESCERLLPVGQDHLERPLREAGVQDQLGEGLGDRWRVLGRLPHDRVAAQERRHDVPRRHRHREVPRRHDRGRSDRDPEREELLVGHLRGHCHAVEAPPLAEVERTRVDDLLDLAV